MNIKWTDEERQFIKDNAAFMKDKELTEKISEMSDRKVTLDAVRKVRQKLGIKKKQGRGTTTKRLKKRLKQHNVS
jgi:transposase